MKIKIFSFLLAFVLISNCFAQKSKVTSGSMALQDGDFEKALKYLTEAVAQPDLLDGKDLAKAYTKMGMSYVGVFSKASQLMAKKETQEQGTALMMKYPNIFKDCFTAFDKAKSYDSDKKFTNEINTGSSTMANISYQYAYEMYSKMKQYKPALELLEPAVKVFEATKNPGTYGLYILQGFCELGINDTAKSIASIQKSLDTYNSTPQQKVDSSMISAYTTLGLLYGTYKGGDYDKFSKVMTEGKAKFPGNKQITDQEIIVFAKNDKFASQAIVKLEEQYKKDPSNKLNAMAYAQILEKSDATKAMVVYKDIASKNPNDKDVHFNIGAILNNMGKDKYDAANATKDNNEYKKLNEEAMTLFKEARSFLDKALTISGGKNKEDEIIILKALVQVTMLLQDMDANKAYKAKLDELKK